MGAVSLVVLLGCCLLFVPIIAWSSDATLNDDVLGLIVFKANLRDPRDSLSSWNEDDSNPCKWVGVKCDNRTNRVTELNLEGLYLSGKIGRGLLQLRSLRMLSLSRNNFSGGISPDLLLIATLQSLDLSQNNLSGAVPDAFFAQCRSVRSVSLAGNRLSGEIPLSLSSCSKIASLNLSSNQFGGAIHSDVWFLNGLRSLDLSFNFFSGEIPAGIDKLYNLRTMSLRSNRLVGSLPANLGSCSQLNSVDLGQNLLSGELPESTRNLSACASLRLDRNSLTGGIPYWVGEMRALETLDLSSNQFAGAFPDSIGELQQLKELNISANALNGTLPESLSRCKALLDVDFGGNNFTGELPRWLFELGLRRASISGNKFTGSILIPTPVTTPSLLALDLSSNAFSGEIPVELGSLHSLQLLNLSRNSISGSIPGSLGELNGVEILDLSGNQLNGSIPPEIGRAASLTSLWLEKNSLTGEIPNQIAACASLSTLMLSQNNLIGSIPESFVNLTHLQTVDLSRNRLNGSLPKWLRRLPQLLSFNISDNLLSGEVPGGNFFAAIPLSSLSGNPSLCGSVLNRSCPPVLPKPIVLNPNSSSTSVAFSSSSDLRHNKIILSISALVAIAAAALIALGVVAITVLNFRVRSSGRSHSAASFLVPPDDSSTRSPATNPNSGRLVMFSGDVPDFSAGTHAVLNKDCELGRGGFGAVYKTLLRDGRPVAIKKLTVSSLVKSQSDFEVEVKKLGKLRHPNIVTMEGYYWTPSLQLLIYEFVAGGSLHRRLHDAAAGVLSWQQRFDIILGMAKGLAHLHHLNIIHYNLKSSNVLVDPFSGEAKIGDCGLAKLLPMLDRYVLSSKIQSALGYMAPEFACPTVKVNEKCDVYGFGVLVLEVVTGKKPVEYQEDDVVVLCDLVRAALEEGRVEESVDPRLMGDFPSDEAVPVVKLGLICTSQVPSNRPDMGDVVTILELIRCPQEASSPREDLS
ncbi:unnamed protein product [Spirodela intermedia]|uniref:Protein kinase domain-containing protein n=1 Tax=Spirodela intermedia TaxID=51605 RepID=A0A7I8K5S7_SPIIN|nr:unnamed protein product [Spirodela intermedia]